MSKEEVFTAARKQTNKHIEGFSEEGEQLTWKLRTRRSKLKNSHRQNRDRSDADPEKLTRMVRVESVSLLDIRPLSIHSPCFGCFLLSTILKLSVAQTNARGSEWSQRYVTAEYTTTCTSSNVESRFNLKQNANIKELPKV